MSKKSSKRPAASEEGRPSKKQRLNSKPFEKLNRPLVKLRTTPSPGAAANKDASLQKNKKEWKPFQSKFNRFEKSKFPTVAKKSEEADVNLTKAEARKKQKEVKKKRKSLNNNYELSMKAKQLWEILRRNDRHKSERLSICKTLHTLIKGKVAELIFAHDTSRVIESVMALGDESIRTLLFNELKGNLLQLCKSKYAKFFVMKILTYGTKEQRDAVLKTFHGCVAKIIRHKEAASVLECAFNEYANASQRAAMVEEFYGPTFALFKDNQVKSLSTVLEKNPLLKDGILSYMKTALDPVVEKSVIRHSLVHRALYEYMSYCSTKDRSEMIENIRDAVVEILHTHDGSRIGILCVRHGTNKDKKVIIKSMKTLVKKICMEQHGHMVLLSIFECVDDTKLVHRALLDEMMKDTLEIIHDQYGRRVILFLLTMGNRPTTYFHPDILKNIKLGGDCTTSKKDNDIRYKELLQAVSQRLLEVLVNNLQEMVFNPVANTIAQAVLANCTGDKEEVFQKLADLAVNRLTPGDTTTAHIVDHSVGHILLKRVIGNDQSRYECGETVFSNILLDKMTLDTVMNWLECNRGAFILVKMIETDITSVIDGVKKLVLPVISKLPKEFSCTKLLVDKLRNLG